MSNIIWDFDGTIADSLPVVMKLFYKLLKHEPYTAAEVEKIRNMPLKEVIAYLHVPLWRVPTLLVAGRKELGKHLQEIPVFKGVPEVIKQLHEAGHTLHVMSSNSSENINRFLLSHDIGQYFSSVHGNAGIFGKTPVIKNIIRKYHLKPENCYSIGDETRDIDAAKKAGLTSIAVTWGYNGEKILKVHQPDFIANNPQELVIIFRTRS